MTNRQRQQSTGRSNISSSTSTVLDSAPVRPLRLRLIPEEATDRTVATVRTDGLELPASSSRLGPRAVEQDRNTFDAYSCRPWAAPSVQSLAQQLGKGEEAHALVVEGRHGDVLTAVGSARDHSVANAVLSSVQEEGGTAGAHLSLYPRPSVRGRSSGRDSRQFGVVYEHRDCFGKPQYVGHTGGVPEGRFLEDARQHQAVRDLLIHRGGCSQVVWAGTAPPSAASRTVRGEGAMQTITSAIVQKRAQELHLDKLRGPKPYSRHGY